MPDFFSIDIRDRVSILRLTSADGTNRLSRACVLALTEAVRELACAPIPKPLIITGNQKFFSAGADLSQIVLLSSDALVFARMGQALTQLVDDFPARVCAAIHGYCMGGGLDLALGCDYRISAPNAEFGHRGAALGLITGWGGTQRLPRLIGRAKALQMFVAAEKLRAPQALAAGLVDAVVRDPVEEALRFCNRINETKNPGRAPL